MFRVRSTGAAMGYRRLETLTDLAPQYWLLLKCRCGHQAKHNPMTVVQVLQRRRDADYRLSQLYRFLKCGRCGGKDFTAEHCAPPNMWANR